MPHPKQMRSHPPLNPLLFGRSTVATTPAPNTIRMAVPIISDTNAWARRLFKVRLFSMPSLSWYSGRCRPKHLAPPIRLAGRSARTRERSQASSGQPVLGRDLRGLQAHLLRGLVVGLELGGSLGLGALTVGGDLPGPGLVVPAQQRSNDVRDLVDRAQAAVGLLVVEPGAVHEDVVEVQRALVGDRVGDLGAQVGRRAEVC